MTMTRAEVETSWGSDPGPAGRRGSDGAAHPRAARRRRAVGRGRASGSIAAGHAVVVPDLPLGAHSYPTAPGADVSPPGIAHLVDALAARARPAATSRSSATTPAARSASSSRPSARTGSRGLVLTPCDAYENFLPPAFRPLQVLARRAPRVLVALVQPMRLRRDPPLAARLRLALQAGRRRRARRAAGCGRSSTLPAHPRDVVRTLAAIDSADTVAAAGAARRARSPGRHRLGGRRPLLPAAARRAPGRRHPGGDAGARSTTPTRSRRSTSPTRRRQLITGLVARARSAQSPAA